MPLVLPRNLWLHGGNRGLTCRSTGRATAYVPGRAALWFIMLRAARAARRSTPVNFNVRQHRIVSATVKSISSVHSARRAIPSQCKFVGARTPIQSAPRATHGWSQKSRTWPCEQPQPRSGERQQNQVMPSAATRTATKSTLVVVASRGAGGGSGGGGQRLGAHRGGSRSRLAYERARVLPNPSFNRTRNGAPRMALISFSAKHSPPQSAG